MLGKPKSGWCRISIGDWAINNASYLEDYPVLLAEAFLWAQNRHREYRDYLLDEDRDNRCFVEINCEGDGWWTVEAREDAVLVWRYEAEDDDSKAEEFVPLTDQAAWSELNRELASDIMDNIHEWTVWESDAYSAYYEPDEAGTADEYRERKERLVHLANELQSACGN